MPKALTVKQRMARAKKLLETAPEPPVAATKAVMNPPGKGSIVERKENVKTVAATEELTPQQMLQVDVIERAWEMRTREAMTLKQIAKALAEEFKMKSVPVHSTIIEWLKKSWAFRTDNIGQYEEQLKNEQYGQMQEALRKWLPIALDDNLALRKSRMVNGEVDYYTDEDCYDEQLKAMQAVIKIWNQMCILFGVGKPQLKAGEELDQKTMQGIVQSVHNYIFLPGQGATAQGNAIDITSERLELTAGVAEIDSL